MGFVAGLILGFTTSSSCPSNAVVLRAARHGGYARMLRIGLGAVSGYALLLGVTLAWIVPFSRTIPQLAPVLEAAGSLVFLYLAYRVAREALGPPESGAQAAPSAGAVRAPGEEAPPPSAGGATADNATAGSGAEDRAPDAAGREGPEGGRRRGFSAGLAATGLNPINLVWWTTLLAPGLRVGSGINPALPAAVLLGSAAWFGSYAWALKQLGDRISDGVHRKIAAAVATVLFAFGLRFLIGGVGGILAF